MLTTGEIVFALIVATIGACWFAHFMLRSRISLHVAMAALSLFPGYMACCSLQEYLNADPKVNSQIPWLYLIFWIFIWISLTMVTLIPGFSSVVWIKIARFIRHLVRFWGPENTPPRAWLATWLFAILNLSLIRASSWGHEFGQGLPPYPRHLWWLWIWLFVLALLFFAISVACVFWDDLYLLIKKLCPEKTELVKTGKTETEGKEGKDKGKQAEAVQPQQSLGTGARMHLILNFISDIATEILFGRRKKLI